MSTPQYSIAQVATAAVAGAVAAFGLTKLYIDKSQRSSNVASSTAPQAHTKRTQSINFANTNFDSQYEYMVQLYPQLIDSFIQSIQSEHQLPEFAIKRVKRMCDYTIIGGKYNRALLVTNTIRILCQQHNIDSSLYGEHAVVLGWCIEILQALFLVADDIMDGSVTRRGKPCWYKLSEIQLDAVNDTLILEALMYYLIDKYFVNTKQYTAITQLFQSVTLNTEMGQMLDLLSQPQGKKGTDILHSFNIELYNKIVKYKTCLYSFYLPLASALILFDAPHLQTALHVARTVSIELGTKFQIQDDYLDCYQDPEILGKIGTDIRDHKCSWLVVQALELCTAHQLSILEKYYGSESGEQEIKKLYNELKLEEVYNKQEIESYNKIQSIINDNTDVLPAEVCQSILDKIHNRQK